MIGLIRAKVFSISTRPCELSPGREPLTTMMFMVVFFLSGPPDSLAGGNSLVAGLSACSQFESDAQRLDCFDKFTRSLTNPAGDVSEEPQVVLEPTTAKSTIPESGEDSFGEKYLPKSRESEPHTAVNYQLLATYKDHKKRWNFEFDNGQTWQQIEPRYLPTPDELPLQVSISKGVFGSHGLRAEYLGKTVKVRRVQ